MKVKELIEKLKACDPNADVDFAYLSDNPTDGLSLTEVLEIRYPGSNVAPTVVLRG